MTEPITQSQKLEALVQRAIDGGWQRLANKRWEVIGRDFGYGQESWVIEKLENVEPIWEDYYHDKEWAIFNHDFARALFGKGIINNSKEVLRQGDIIEYKDWPAAWQHHLQQAVVSDDPISYMYEAVFGNTSFEVNGVRHEWTND